MRAGKFSGKTGRAKSEFENILKPRGEKFLAVVGSVARMSVDGTGDRFSGLSSQVLTVSGILPRFFLGFLLFASSTTNVIDNRGIITII